MKIIISPSKTLKEQPYTLTPTQPLFYKQAELIKKKLLTLNPQEIEKRMHVSKKLSGTIYDHLHQTKKVPALYYYTGTVFKQLDLANYLPQHHQYLSSHLYILDALYGCLRYQDEISFYRLDFLCQLEGVDLYHYWQKEVNDLLQKEDVIINLASQEYTKHIKHPNIITIDFAVIDNNKLKRPSMLIKKARGSMLNNLILYEIKDLATIKEMNIDGYHYSETYSSLSHYVFIKD